MTKPHLTPPHKLTPRINPQESQINLTKSKMREMLRARRQAKANPVTENHTKISQK